VIDKGRSNDLLEKSLNDFFLFGYKEYYLNNNTPDFQRALFEVDNLIEWSNGYIIAQYHQFLNLCLKKPVEKVEYSHIVQMLILDYLGIGKGIKSDTEKAKLYAPLLRRDIKSTRVYFSELYEGKNIKNLNIILEFFEKAGFPDQVYLVKKEIDRINNKKK
jgi:hypothetical protein